VGLDLDDAAHKLVDAANQAGGTDNITVLLLECRQN
jgi:serine/threonine protein phosphatase PrpC